MDMKFQVANRASFITKEEAEDYCDQFRLPYAWIHPLDDNKVVDSSQGLVRLSDRGAKVLNPFARVLTEEEIRANRHGLTNPPQES